MNKASIVFLVFGCLGFFIGIALKLYISRRKFYRRNSAGLEEFKNFRTSLLTPFWETILNLIAILLILFGILLLALSYSAWG